MITVLFRDVSGSSTPRKVTTPTLGTRANKYRRFHSVPRSSTIDGIVDASNSPRLDLNQFDTFYIN